MNPRRDNCFHCAAKTTPDLNKIKVPPKLNPVDANPAAATLRFITGPHVSRHQHRHYKTHGKKIAGYVSRYLKALEKKRVFGTLTVYAMFSNVNSGGLWWECDLKCQI